MANRVKNYFLAPSWDYSPTSQPSITIALWNIVTGPTKMVPPLAAASAIPALSETVNSTKYGCDWTGEENKVKKFGIWNRFLAAISPVNVGYESGKMAHDLFTFEAMVTKEAYPTNDYLERMVNQGAVRSFLERFDFKKPVYVVVGTKEVTGVSAKHVEGTRSGTQLKLSANLAMTGVPVSLGPEARTTNRSNNMTAFKGSSDFVFAFRIRKLVISPRFKIVSEDDADGGMLGDFDDDLGDKIEVEGLEDVDCMDVTGRQRESVEDDGEKVFVTPLN